MTVIQPTQHEAEEARGEAAGEVVELSRSKIFGEICWVVAAAEKVPRAV